MLNKQESSFKNALAAAIKKKLADMPQMLVCADLRDELEDRRKDFEPRKCEGISTEEAARGFFLGVDSVYELLYKLLEVAPAEWGNIET